MLRKYRPTTIDKCLLEPKICNHLISAASNSKFRILINSNQGSGRSTLINAFLNNYYNCNHQDTIQSKRIASNLFNLHSGADYSISQLKVTLTTFCQTISSLPSKNRTIVCDDIDFLSEGIQHLINSVLEQYPKINIIASCYVVSHVIQPLQSRLFQIKIGNISNIRLQNITKSILQQEGFNVCDKSIDYIVIASHNKLRTLISSLQKVILYGDKNATTQDIEAILCTINSDIWQKYINFLYSKKISAASLLLQQVLHKGLSALDLADSLYDFLILKSRQDSQYYHILKELTSFIATHETTNNNYNSFKISVFLTNRLFMAINNAKYINDVK